LAFCFCKIRTKGPFFIPNFSIVYQYLLSQKSLLWVSEYEVGRQQKYFFFLNTVRIYGGYLIMMDRKLLEISCIYERYLLSPEVFLTKQFL